MNVAYLGPDSPLVSFIESSGSRVWRTEAALDDIDADFIVSFGYRHILPRKITDEFSGRAVNLHVSYLPYNRGAHPLYWALFDDTPVGVSIHYINENVDRGDVIEQRYAEVKSNLSDTYIHLQEEMQRLFMARWPDIRRGRCQRVKQTGRGTYHAKQELDSQFSTRLPQGWLTPVTDVVRMGKESRKYVDIGKWRTA